MLRPMRTACLSVCLWCTRLHVGQAQLPPTVAPSVAPVVAGYSGPFRGLVNKFPLAFRGKQTPENCGAICLATSGCKMFRWHTQSTMCRLYSLTLEDAIAQGKWSPSHTRKTMHYSLLPQTTVSSASSTSASSMSTLLSRGSSSSTSSSSSRLLFRSTSSSSTLSSVSSLSRSSSSTTLTTDSTTSTTTRSLSSSTSSSSSLTTSGTSSTTSTGSTTSSHSTTSTETSLPMTSSSSTSSTTETLSLAYPCSDRFRNHKFLDVEGPFCDIMEEGGCFLYTCCCWQDSNFNWVRSECFCAAGHWW
mmetsp:Transcript_33335/g.76005  ORF Transcript_33335/g.76005 Transcript_33335/m.76005 type:complete len:303 (+) Transcript_33335:86-994(+)